MYTDFAEIYDRLMKDTDYPGWAEYYSVLLQKYVRPGGRVCECACGTGSLTVLLRGMGWRMTGIDLSREMLARAMEKSRQAGMDIPFVCQDMCALSVPGRQDAVLCTCDGVNYLLTPGRAARFFTSAFSALRPGGVLIFDVSTPWKLQNILGDQVLASRDEDISYIWMNAYHPSTRTVDMHLSFFIRQEDGSYRRIEEDQRQRAYSGEELERFLTEAGFRKIKIYGDRSLRAPGPRAVRWHVTAMRPKEK